MDVITVKENESDSWWVVLLWSELVAHDLRQRQRSIRSWSSAATAARKTPLGDPSPSWMHVSPLFVLLASSAGFFAPAHTRLHRAAHAPTLPTSCLISQLQLQRRHISTSSGLHVALLESFAARVSPLAEHLAVVEPAAIRPEDESADSGGDGGGVSCDTAVFSH